jgi:hypothetical protein
LDLDVREFHFHALRRIGARTRAEFNKVEGEPTRAAVLAFVNVYPRSGVDPVLYLHPASREICPRRSGVSSAGASIPWPEA